MTVIAWDGKTLAADKRAVMYGTRLTTTKIWREYLPGFSDAQCLFGGAGTQSLVLEMMRWLRNGADPAALPEKQRDKDEFADVLVICDGRVLHYQRGPIAQEYEAPHFAIGSGKDAALAAMHLGCDARRAVEVACVIDSGCGNGIDVLDFVPAPPAREPEPEAPKGPLRLWVEARCKEQRFNDWIAAAYPELWTAWRGDALLIAQGIFGPIDRLDSDPVAQARFERKIRSPYES